LPSTSFFHGSTTTVISTLSLHDALPIFTCSSVIHDETLRIKDLCRDTIHTENRTEGLIRNDNLLHGCDLMMSIDVQTNRFLRGHLLDEARSNSILLPSELSVLRLIDERHLFLHKVNSINRRCYGRSATSTSTTHELLIGHTRISNNNGIRSAFTIPGIRTVGSGLNGNIPTPVPVFTHPCSLDVIEIILVCILTHPSK